jgi:TonB family protein
MRALLWGAVVCGCLVGQMGALAAQPLNPPAPVRVGGNIGPPTKIRHVAPVYPEDALAARVMGVVILEANIGTDGNVTNARVLRGVPMLNDAAIDAVKQWQYEPTLLNGTPVPVIMTVTVNFTLDRPAGQPDGMPGMGVPPGAPGARAGGEGGAPAAATNPYLVTPSRVGLIRLGMMQEELNRVLPATQLRAIPRNTPRRLTSDIEIALEPGGPAALVASVDNGRVFQIEVRNERFRTAQGIGIGTSLGELRRRDPGLRVVNCDRGPCATISTGAFTFGLNASAASASDLAQIPDTALVTRVLVGQELPPPPPSGPLPRE